MNRLVWLLFFVSQLAFAYPSFIGYGYTSCLTCHYNPSGYGPLTAYGRALYATELAAKPFYNSGATDEELGAQSGFLGSLGEMPSWLDLAANYRGLYYVTDLGKTTSSSRFIHMQTEGSLVLKTSDQRLYAVGSLAYVPHPSTAARNQTDISTSISREHYMGWRPNKYLGLYVGMMDPIFGIKVPDHTAFIRSMTALNQNDQVHGAVLHATDKKWDAFLHAIAGNLYQEADLRQKGASVMGEYSLSEKLRAGLSGISTKSDLRSRQMIASHLRWGIPKGSSVLAEIAFIRDSRAGQNNRLGDAFFLQGQTRLVRGLEALLTIEQYSPAFSDDQATRYFRAGPGLQYFPFQRIELRLDLMGTRASGPQTTSADSFALLSQMHVSL